MVCYLYFIVVHLIMVGIVTDKFQLLGKILSVVSLMRKLGARDFKDLLQVCLCLIFYHYDTDKMKCAIPIFEGLLPKKHDRIVGKLLFELCTWHGLAKLRLHTETTVNDLEHSTTRLGNVLHQFRKEVCSSYITNELPTEEAARIRRKAAAAKRLGQSAAPSNTNSSKSCQQRTVRGPSDATLLA
jgi:hypothetical protein